MRVKVRSQILGGWFKVTLKNLCPPLTLILSHQERKTIKISLPTIFITGHPSHYISGSKPDDLK